VKVCRRYRLKMKVHHGSLQRVMLWFRDLHDLGPASPTVGNWPLGCCTYIQPREHMYKDVYRVYATTYDTVEVCRTYKDLYIYNSPFSREE
jgi:hypothetical protein